MSGAFHMAFQFSNLRSHAVLTGHKHVAQTGNAMHYACTTYSDTYIERDSMIRNSQHVGARTTQRHWHAVRPNMGAVCGSPSDWNMCVCRERADEKSAIGYSQHANGTLSSLSRFPRAS